MSAPRYLENSGQPFQRVDAHGELIRALERIIINAPPTAEVASASRTAGLYAGFSSTAFLLLRLSTLYKNLRVQDRSLRTWSARYVQAAASLPEDPPGSSHCGIANETLVKLTLQALSGTDSIATKAVTAFCSFADRITNSSDFSASNEWLYGRAGYLYLLRLLTSHLRDIDDTATQLLARTAHSVANSVIHSPQPWTWHGKNYVGAAHGTIGIITQLVLTFPSLAPRLEGQLSNLLSLQSTETGNFPSSLPSHSSESKLIQFCHGAPGMLISLMSLRPYFPTLTTKIDAAISLGRKCIWEKGLLTKNPSLCHGITGNALALDEQEQIECFLSYTTPEAVALLGDQFLGGERREVDRYLSLFTGEAGRCWGWAVLDLGLEGRCIGFNDI